MKSTLSTFADEARCEGDALCKRIHRQQPYLPIAPPFEQGLKNPCVRAGGTVCIPQVHVLGGWHSFVEEALAPLLKAHPALAINDRLGVACFNEWDSSPQSAGRWFGGWGVRPSSERQLVQQCVHELSFYPAYPNGYLRDFLAAYWPCKAREVETLKARGKDEGAYYGGDGPMWRTCRPEALAKHDAGVGTGGVGHEVTPPFVMRAVYGSRSPTLIALLRNPVDRLETSFWCREHSHYVTHYGASADGFHKFAVEGVDGFRACERRHSTRRCALLFEMLEKEMADVFFHADQVIRGIYHPFVAEWKAAFPSTLIVIRTEDLMDDPTPTKARLFSALGLQPPDTADPLARGSEAGLAPSKSYAEMHARSVRGGTPNRAVPMHQHTREMLISFYHPYNARLAALLNDRRLEFG